MASADGRAGRCWASVRPGGGGGAGGVWLAQPGATRSCGTDANAIGVATSVAGGASSRAPSTGVGEGAWWHGLVCTSAAASSFAVGDRVWRDANANGVQDAGEPGLAGVPVTLFDSSGATVATTTTDGAGRYLFDRLPAGTYRLGFGLLPNCIYTISGAGERGNRLRRGPVHRLDCRRLARHRRGQRSQPRRRRRSRPGRFDQPDRGRWFGVLDHLGQPTRRERTATPRSLTCNRPRAPRWTRRPVWRCSPPLRTGSRPACFWQRPGSGRPGRAVLRGPAELRTVRRRVPVGDRPDLQHDLLDGNFPPFVSRQTEAWLDLRVDSSGWAIATTTVPFTPSAAARSVVVYSGPTLSAGLPTGLAAVCCRL